MNHFLESQQQQPNSGGAAPSERACNYTLSDGHTCRDWALRGQKYCFRHHRFIRSLPERPVDIPLLEDQASILYVLSQTAQALAWGTLPTANGLAILKVCRLAHNLLDTGLETAKLRYKVRRAGIPEQEIFPPQQPATPTAAHPQQGAEGATPSPQQEANAEPGFECETLHAERRTEPCALNSEPSSPNPVKVPPAGLAFRDLKKDWDKALLRTGNAVGDMYSRRHGETREDFLTARATPFQHLAEADREVERARALAKAHDEALAQAQQTSPQPPDQTQPQPSLPAC